MDKVKPIVFSVGAEKRYYGIGEPLAEASSEPALEHETGSLELFFVGIPWVA